MTIGEKIKFYRIEKGISQKYLASLIGVNVSFLCKIEKNEKKISLDKLKLVIQILDLKENDLENEFFINKIEELLINVNIDSKSIIFDQLIKKYKNEK